MICTIKKKYWVLLGGSGEVSLWEWWQSVPFSSKFKAPNKKWFKEDRLYQDGRKAPKIHQESIFLPSLNHLDGRSTLILVGQDTAVTSMLQMAGGRSVGGGERGPHPSLKETSRVHTTTHLLNSPGHVLLQRRLGNVVTMSHGKVRVPSLMWKRRDNIGQYSSAT